MRCNLARWSTHTAASAHQSTWHARIRLLGILRHSDSATASGERLGKVTRHDHEKS